MSVKYRILFWITDIVYPGWQEIVGLNGKRTHFSIWLSEKPFSFQDRARTSDNPLVVAGLIRQFRRERGIT